MLCAAYVQGVWRIAPLWVRWVGIYINLPAFFDIHFLTIYNLFEHEKRTVHGLHGFCPVHCSLQRRLL